jgi:hypothetical protein
VYPAVVLRCCCVCYAVTQEAKYKCDIYMVFDYAEHDLTGLMDATRHAALRPDQVRITRGCMQAHDAEALGRCMEAPQLHCRLSAAPQLGCTQSPGQLCRDC